MEVNAHVSVKTFSIHGIQKTIGSALTEKGERTMPDREKVIEALENADVKDGVIKMSTQFRDVVIALLKEQEKASKRNPVIVCPHCGKRIK